MHIQLGPISTLLFYCPNMPNQVRMVGLLNQALSSIPTQYKMGLVFLSSPSRVISLFAFLVDGSFVAWNLPCQKWQRTKSTHILVLGFNLEIEAAEVFIKGEHVC